VEAAEAELERVGQSCRASTADVAAAQARVTGAEAVLTNSRAQPSACCRRSCSPALPEC
jgi:hypothetical protein